MLTAEALVARETLTLNLLEPLIGLTGGGGETTTGHLDVEIWNFEDHLARQVQELRHILMMQVELKNKYSPMFKWQLGSKWRGDFGGTNIYSPQ